MSKKGVEEFYDALANDAQLQEKMMKVASSPEVNKLIVSKAKEAGYDFTEADLKEYSEMDKGGMDNAYSDWACTCAVAGSGHYKGNYQCGCFFGGGGKSDPDGFYLFCVAAGSVTRF